MYGGNETLKASGPLSIAVPGEVSGLHEAWKKYGKLPWKKLVIPAARLAHRGFKISPYLHLEMVSTESEIKLDEGLRNIFTSKNGTLLKIGDKCHNKKLAKSLVEIAKHGPKAFYNGSIGYNLVKDVQKAGGILTMEDLRNYQVKIRKPLFADTWGVQILGMPPPSSGGPSMVLVSKNPPLSSVFFYLSHIIRNFDPFYIIYHIKK